jgi:hypothetical protein
MINMKKIDPTTLYETPEIKGILLGFVKLETLRQFGLVALPGKGYWGKAVIDALNRYCHNVCCQRGGVDGGKENVIDAFQHTQPLFDNPAELGNLDPAETRPMENQLDRFRRLTASSSVQCINSDRSGKDGRVNLSCSPSKRSEVQERQIVSKSY